MHIEFGMEIVWQFELSMMCILGIVAVILPEDRTSDRVFIVQHNMNLLQSR